MTGSRHTHERAMRTTLDRMKEVVERDRVSNHG